MCSTTTPLAILLLMRTCDMFITVKVMREVMFRKVRAVVNMNMATITVVKYNSVGEC